jgi:hypothetical protein
VSIVPFMNGSSSEDSERIFFEVFRALFFPMVTKEKGEDQESSS